MKKLIVRYRGWSESWPLGQLAHNGNETLFEYSNEALLAGFEPSPIRMPVRREAYGELPSYLHHLPGFIADALPDGWGLLLMDRHFRRAGIELATISPLDRLAFLGDRAMGAYTFEPAATIALTRDDTTLLELAREVRTVLSGKDDEVLSHLLLLGGSPHGARPKVLVNYDPAQGTISTSPAHNHRPYLIKFPAQNEHREVCAVEHVYCETAAACGLDVPATHYFDLGRTHAAFGSARFDIEEDLRVPVHTLAGALHANFRVPSVDYISLLRATRAFTRDETEVVKAYERAVFNVLFNNRDDHCKNFAFRLGRDRQWRLAPGYDLTFNMGPGGEHQMDVCGEARRITRAHMVQLAEKGGIKARVAAASLERVLAEVAPFEKRLRAQPVRETTVRTIIGCVRENQAALRS